MPFEPTIPYSAIEGTEIRFTLPFDGGWLDYRAGNTDSPYKIQIQYPESIQDSYEIVWPDVDQEDPENPVDVDGSLSFIMPAENVTLNIDLVENPEYIEPTPEYELTIVNNLPEGWTCEIAKLYGDDAEPVPIEDINSNITINEGAEVFVKVFNENNEPVNYFNVANEASNSYTSTHESVETMRLLNVYCSIEGEFNDEITIDDTAYTIYGQDVAESDNFGYGEVFAMPMSLTLTIQKP